MPAKGPAKNAGVDWRFEDQRTSDDMNFFEPDQTDNRAQTYESKYVDDAWRQKCGASVPLWTVRNGGPADEATGTTAAFWKEGTTLQMSSGFRIWKQDGHTFSEADAGTIEYKLWEFNDKKRNQLFRE